MCSQRVSIEQATKRLKNAPKAPTIRYHLRNKLDLEHLELALTILSGKCLEFAKHCTTHFHAYATLYLIVLGKRFTLAIKYMILVQFLDVISILNLKIKRVYMDKGFCNAAVIKYAARARTSSQSPELRLLYVALDGLTFHDFLDFIVQGCKAIKNYPCVSAEQV
ncbi:MAG: hypothetical protein ACE5KE_15885 [Methanosarcinales archaeon]